MYISIFLGSSLIASKLNWCCTTVTEYNVSPTPATQFVLPNLIRLPNRRKMHNTRGGVHVYNIFVFGGKGFLMHSSVHIWSGLMHRDWMQRWLHCILGSMSSVLSLATCDTNVYFYIGPCHSIFVTIKLESSQN